MNSRGTRSWAARIRTGGIRAGGIQAVLIVAGALTVGYGGLQLLQVLFAGTAPLFGVAGWWLGGPLIVDLMVVPIVVVVGVGVRRVVPAAWRRSVSAALALSFVLGLVALPFLTGLGRRTDNPSLLDRNYWAGYLALVAIIWGVAAVVTLGGRFRRAGRASRKAAADRTPDASP